MQLRLELFVDDLDRSLDFYTRVLDFRIDRRKDDGFTELRHGDAFIALNRREILHPDHPLHARPGERRGLGMEVTLYAPDVRAAFDRAVAAGWPISTELTAQPWGRTDFRLLDPDGTYIRISDGPGDP